MDTRTLGTLSKNQVRYLLLHSALRLKTLTSSPQKEYGNINYADRALEEIFGYRNLCRQLRLARTEAHAFRILDGFGLDRIFTITLKESYFKALQDLVQMDAELAVLKKQRRKLTQKGKKCSKSLLKEIKYFEEQYSKGCKTLRKLFGLSKKKTSYKSKFSNINDLIERREDYSNLSEHLGYFDMLDDDLEDDFLSPSGNEMEDFIEQLKRYGGNNPSKRSDRYNRSKRNFLDDLDLDNLEDDNDDLDDDEEEEDDTTLRLMQNVTDLTKVVQGLVAQQNGTPVEKPLFQASPKDTSDMSILLTEVQKIGQSQQNLASKIDQLRTDTDDIIDFLSSDEEDGDDSEFDALGGFRSPIEVVQKLLENRDLSTYDRQRLIQELNRLKAQEAGVREKEPIQSTEAVRMAYEEVTSDDNVQAYEEALATRGPDLIEVPAESTVTVESSVKEVVVTAKEPDPKDMIRKYNEEHTPNQ